jgi:nucleotide-binding universal stress UspA family protein
MTHHVPVCPGKWKKLLVCTDGSPESRDAVRVGLDLGRRCDARVVVFQALDINPEFEAVAPELMPRVEEEIRAWLEAMKAEAAARGMSIDTRWRRRVPAYAAIIEEAAEMEADLILMGRHGRSGLARLLLGSVTGRVIGHSPINVLVVPKEAVPTFAKVLIANDGSPYGNAAWEEALSLARGSGGALYGICVAREEGDIPEADAILKKMLAAGNEHGVPVTAVMPQGQAPDDAIIQAALKYGVDLIILGSHGRTGLSRLLMGSVTERVIGSAPCPVLVVVKR